MGPALAGMVSFARACKGLSNQPIFFHGFVIKRQGSGQGRSHATSLNIMNRMERIQLFNSQRMKWCCTDYGTTPYELASKLNIPLATMERVLRGEDGLTFHQLSKIASFFGRGVLFFLEPGPVVATRGHTSAFRPLADHTPA